MSEKKTTTVSQQRRIVSYPSPKVYDMIEDYRVKNGFTRSEAVEYIARRFFDTTTPTNINSIPKGRNHY